MILADRCPHCGGNEFVDFEDTVMPGKIRHCLLCSRERSLDGRPLKRPKFALAEDGRLLKSARHIPGGYRKV